MTTVAEPRPMQVQYMLLWARLLACSPASAAAGSASGSTRAAASAAMGAAAGLLLLLLGLHGERFQRLRLLLVPALRLLLATLPRMHSPMVSGGCWVE